MNRTTTGTLGMTLVLVAATFLSSGAVAAQRFGGHGGGSLAPPERVLEHLGISDLQLEQIGQLREDAKSILGPLHEEQKGYRQQLRTLLESEAPNATDVGNVVIATRHVGEEIRATEQSFREQFQLMLTPEQLTAWEEFNSNRQSRRRGSRQGFRGSRDGSPEGF